MYCKLLRCVVWFVGLASRFELPQSQSSDPDVDLNGSFANSWAVFVSTSFCSQGGLKTKRGKTSFRLALHVCPRVIREDGRHGRFCRACRGPRRRQLASGAPDRRWGRLAWDVCTGVAASSL
ncbi:unnamed protein product [Prorocentrum cordatum]|uniref:Secreted protein n=1 Tax=Prorocentrum cordatum TaxID=2364126 RepID=A0ABN9SCK0_9DINO|nr:unnamed protein product [Polarella glacialis]